MVRELSSRRRTDSGGTALNSAAPLGERGGAGRITAVFEGVADGQPILPTLGQLVAASPGGRLVRGDPAAPVAGICYDSRRLEPHDLFVAVPGRTHDGHRFIAEAVARGASAVVAERMPADAALGMNGSVPLVLVPSARAALADLAGAFYRHPSRQLRLVGVTGTDGKTTTVHLVDAILEARGLRTGRLSTIETKIDGFARSNPTGHTTPEAPLVQRTLAEMMAVGVEAATLEVSSHAIALDRVRGCAFDVAVFTNLSPEHLDFHGTVEEYRAAKARLLATLPADGLAVVNADDPNAGFMRDATPAPVLTYALEGPAHVRATDVRTNEDGTMFTVHVAPGSPAEGGRGGVATVRTQLVGRFNVANWLAAYCAATAFGATLDDLRLAAAEQPPILGRMNFVRQGQPFHVVVDFAHTPQALGRVLDAAAMLARGRVLLMFGLPGGRDPRNRTVMGRLAATRSDFFAVTTDDPYDEDPAQIAAQIEDGAREAGARPGADYVVELDRRAALRRLLGEARVGDVVLIAGHGHLDQLVVGARSLPWNDAVVAAEELRALGYDRPR